MYRAWCLMMAGKCDAGKVLLRKTYEISMAQFGDDLIDNNVEQNASMYCQGKMSPRDELLKNMTTLNNGANLKKLTVAECTAAYEAVRRLKDKVKPKDEDDRNITTIKDMLPYAAAQCFAKAGDCKQARVVFDASLPKDRYANITDPKTKAEVMLSVFDSNIPKCKSKPAQ